MPDLFGFYGCAAVHIHRHPLAHRTHNQQRDDRKHCSQDESNNVAKPFIDVSIDTPSADPVLITDIIDASHLSNSVTNSSAKTTPGLGDVDALFGPLQFGECTVSRKELHAMSATLNGKEITGANTYFADAEQGFIDALVFDPGEIKRRMTSAVAQDAQLVATLMYEIATRRSPGATPLFGETTQSIADADMDAVSKVLGSVQRMDITRTARSDSLPHWVNRAKTRAMSVVGVGMQLYGLYSAYRGAIEALKRGDAGEVALNLGGGVTEVASMGIEYAMSKTGQHMIQQGSQNLELFRKTAAGKWLARSSGMVAAVLTLPFDVYTAIKSFNDAASAEGKKAQDLYVTGGLSVASAGISLALGVAALMGLQYAGPIGLVAAGLMIAGAAIYQPVRVVDDIDDYIELTVGERWRAGWLAFWAVEQDTALMDRFKAAKTYSDYEKLLKSRSLQWLENEFKDRFEAVYLGRFEVTLEPRRIHRFSWKDGEQPYDPVNTPTVRETDDVLAAWDGVPNDKDRVVFGHRDAAKGVFWQLGDGNDYVIGVGAQPNHFSLGSGRKQLKGGNKDDAFVFQSAAQTLTDGYKQAPGALDGGNGADLLWLQGKHQAIVHGTDPTPYRGYNIDLQAQRLELMPVDKNAEPVLHARMTSIEKVETLAGASNTVVGSNKADVITANGDDAIQAGDGNDHVSLRGSDCRAEGGPGLDTYYLHKASRHIAISEDGKSESLVYLGVPLELVQAWKIQGQALVIHSLRDAALESPQREVLIKNVYEQREGKRSLLNAKWLFITEDGYYLQPDLPGEIAGTEDVGIEVLVIVQGTAKPSPVLLNDSREINAAEYFMDRGTTSRHLRVNQASAAPPCTLYLDFDSSEIQGVDATYTVDVKKHLNTALSYSSLSYRIRLNDSLLFIHNPMIENPVTKTDRGGGIFSSSWKAISEITLVMRDGVSYALDAPRNNHSEDAQKPGSRSIESRTSLRERAGRYTCVPPTTNRYALKATPQKISFPALDYRCIYHLDGQSSYYALYPSRNMSLQLSTVEGSQGSVWNIYTDNVDDRINRKALTLENNLLEIGTVHVQLAHSENPNALLETVYVFLTCGITYKVHALFNWIELYAIDAAACASIPAIVEEIHRHRQYELNQVFAGTRILIHNLQLIDASAGAIYYVADTDTWELDSDRARAINIDDLTIEKPSSTENS